jgi:hypothetical protein
MYTRRRSENNGIRDRREKEKGTKQGRLPDLASRVEDRAANLPSPLTRGKAPTEEKRRRGRARAIHTPRRETRSKEERKQAKTPQAKPQNK